MSNERSILQNHYQDASRLDARIQLHAKYSTNTQGLHAWVFEHLRLPAAGHVLEVGCGSGQGFLFAQPMDADATLEYLRIGGAEHLQPSPADAP